MRRGDIGYDRTSIEWTHKTFNLKSTTTIFQEEYDLLGDTLIEILNAAKRIRQHTAANSISNAITAVRSLTRALALSRAKLSTIESWATTLIEHLRARTDLAETTRASTFSHAHPILAELARCRGERYRVRSPFSRRRSKPQSIIPASERTALINAAKAAALEIERSFRNPPEEFLPFIDRARALVALGVRIERGAGCDPRVDRLFREFRYKTKRTNATPLFLAAYPKANHLMPFLILLTYALAGNIDAVSLLRRDSLTKYDHPDFGECLKLDLLKPRSGEAPLSYLVRDRGTLSVGWIIRTVMDLTDGIAKLAPRKLRNYAFLAGSGNEVALLLGASRHRALKRFLRDNNLKHALLNKLRVTRATEEMQKSRDPFRVTRLLHHRSPSTTFDYLQALEAALVDSETIADAQQTLRVFKSKPAARRRGSDGSAKLASHTCADPWHDHHGTDEHGFCANLLWPFNDRHFVLSLEPMPVALLLRDYSALAEAELNLPAERFAQHFAPRKRIIEVEVLPLIDRDLRRAAEELIPSLPQVPSLA